MNQAKLFENQYLQAEGKRRYGRSQHYHHVSRLDNPESFMGERMVFSTIIEMLSNVSFVTALKRDALSPPTMTSLYRKPFGNPQSSKVDPID